MWATWRRRSVGARSASRASTTSWPWAHVSISRAVMNDRAPIAGPYHGTRSFGSTVRAYVDEAAAVGPPAIEQLVGREVAALLVGDVGAAAQQRLGIDPERVGVGERQQRPLVEEPEVGDLVADRPAGGRGRRPRGRRPRRSDRGRRARRSARHTACPRRQSATVDGLRSASARRAAPATPTDRSRSGLLGGALRPAPAWPAPSWPAAFLAGACLAGSLLGRRLLGRRLLGRSLLGRRPSWPAAFLAGAFLAARLLGRRLLGRSLLGRRLLGRRLLGRRPSWPEPSSPRPSWPEPSSATMVTSFFFGLSAVLSVALGVNFIAVEAAIFTGAPVCGLRPVRAARLVWLNEPKPGHATFRPSSSPWSRGRRTHRSCARRPPWTRRLTSRPHR